MNAQQLITQHLDIWTAVHKTRSSAGRGSSNKLDLVGIKKLRELILELAVRGKLVPQDPSDESANKLLRKIAVEKSRLIKEGKIKKGKPLPMIREEEKPFELPRGWEWVRLSEITSIRGGSTPSMANSEFWGGDIPWVSPKDMHDGVIVDSELKITTKALNEKNLELVPVGSILIVGRSGILKRKLPAQITAVPCTVNQDIKAVTPIKPLSERYMQLIFWGNEREILERDVKQGTTVQSLVYESLFSRPFSLPPAKEQNRIIAKVDELMAFCDQLEQTQSDNIAAHAQLVEALLATLTASTNHNELQTNWQRIAKHFDILFTTEHSIDQLKQTILQLAVMGKLVPQNPNDEPVSELLKKIATEKAQLIKEGKIKREKPLPEITDEEKPFELSSGWEWIRLNELLPQFQNGASSRGDKGGKSVVVLRLADIKDWKISLSDTRKLEISEDTINRYSLQKGDVLIIRVNGSADIVGRFINCETDYDAIYCDHFIRMNFPVECLHSPYLFLLGSSELIRDRISDLFVSTAGQKTVNQTHIGSLLISLPPLAEQHRIVAKVDELMALCNDLKTNIQNAQTTQLALADALVAQAIN